MEYAGSMRRVAAFLIDLVVVPLVGFAIFMGLAFAGGIVAGILGTSEETDDRVFDNLVGPVSITLFFAVPLLYSAVLEAAAGGTVGKLLLKIHVSRIDGARLGFGRALGRAIAKMFSVLIAGLGFLLAPLTERHQALHDLLAGTTVLRAAREQKPAERVLGPPREQAETPVMIREG
jgi:uncharacterized RDD family membrane protein YckC